jgi:hypothetical protein
VEVRYRGGKTLGVRLLAPIPRTPQGRLPVRRTSGGPRVGPVRGPGRAYRPGILRRGGPALDRRGRRGRRPPRRHPAGGAAGGVLRLDVAGGRGVALTGRPRRHRAGLRRGRRYRRLQPHRHHRERRHPGSRAYQRRRAHPSRRRQHGPRPRLHAARQAGGGRNLHRRLAVSGAGPRRVQCQGGAVQRRQPGRGAHRRAVAGLQSDGRHGIDEARPEHLGAGGARRLLPAHR